MKKQIAEFEVTVNRGVVTLPDVKSVHVYTDAIGANFIQNQCASFGFGMADDPCRSASISMIANNSIVRGMVLGSEMVDVEIAGVFKVRLFEDRKALDARDGVK